jgi:hypothetical protein
MEHLALADSQKIRLRSILRCPRAKRKKAETSGDIEFG